MGKASVNKMTLGSINSIMDSMNELVKIKLPVKASYWVKRAFDEVDSENKTFLEKRAELFKEYGDKQEDTLDTYVIPKEKMEKFQEEFKKLSEIEVDLDVKSINISELGDITIESKYLFPWLFTDGTEKVEKPEKKSK